MGNKKLSSLQLAGKGAIYKGRDLEGRKLYRFLSRSAAEAFAKATKGTFERAEGAYGLAHNIVAVG
jgi:hypothetical protein